jgi:hypothetical protein
MMRHKVAVTIVFASAAAMTCTPAASDLDQIEEALKRDAKRDIHVGSTRAEVQQFIVSHGMRFTADNKTRTIRASIRSRDESKIVRTAGIFLRFYFGSDDRLEKYEVYQAYTGP